MDSLYAGTCLAPSLSREEEARLNERAAFMEAVNKNYAAWIVVRDEAARLSRLHDVDIASDLEEAHGLMCDIGGNIQGAIRRQYE